MPDSNQLCIKSSGDTTDFLKWTFRLLYSEKSFTSSSWVDSEAFFDERYFNGNILARMGIILTRAD